MFIYIFN